MINLENEVFLAISRCVDKDLDVQKYTQRGYCRAWAANAKRVVMQEVVLLGGISVEAREVDIDPWTTHSFLKITINNNAYLMDGSGIDQERSGFYGLEEEAPQYLKDSRPDIMINHY